MQHFQLIAETLPEPEPRVCCNVHKEPLHVWVSQITAVDGKDLCAYLYACDTRDASTTEVNGEDPGAG